MIRNNVMPYLPGIKVSKVLKFFIRRRVVVGKYFIIIQLGLGESNGPSNVADLLLSKWSARRWQGVGIVLCALFCQFEVDFFAHVHQSDRPVPPAARLIVRSVFTMARAKNGRISKFQVSLKNLNHGKYQNTRYSYSLITNLRFLFLNLERHVDVLAHAWQKHGGNYAQTR